MRTSSNKVRSQGPPTIESFTCNHRTCRRPGRATPEQTGKYSALQLPAVRFVKEFRIVLFASLISLSFATRTSVPELPRKRDRDRRALHDPASIGIERFHVTSCFRPIDDLNHSLWKAWGILDEMAGGPLIPHASPQVVATWNMYPSLAVKEAEAGTLEETT